MIVKYEGNYELRAIQALRIMSGKTVSQAEKAIENPYGMEMDARTYTTLVAVYLGEWNNKGNRLDFRIVNCPPSPTKVTLG